MGNGLRQPCGVGVVAAHGALQFGKFADHPRLQIGLGQTRRLARLGRVQLEMRRQVIGQDAHPLDFVGIAAQLLLVGDIGQSLAHRLQTLLAIFVEEELGIGKTRANHPFIALPDLLLVAAGHIGDAHEMGVKPALAIKDGEKFLIGLHGQDQGFLRHAQKARLEAAEQAHRPLIQTVHLFQDARIDTRLAGQ